MLSSSLRTAADCASAALCGLCPKLGALECVVHVVGDRGPARASLRAVGLGQSGRREPISGVTHATSMKRSICRKERQRAQGEKEREHFTLERSVDYKKDFDGLIPSCKNIACVCMHDTVLEDATQKTERCTREHTHILNINALNLFCRM